MSNVLYRNFTLDLPQIAKGEGSWLWDLSGKKYLDLSGGAFVNALGHGREDLIQRIADQMKKVSYVNGWHFSSPQLEEYAPKLLKHAPAGFSHVALLGSGSEAVEAALKIVRQAFFESGKTTKHKIIARSPGYHGNTGLALSASARKYYKKFFSSYLTEITFVSAPQEYRSKDIDYLAELEETILKLGPENVSTFILETVMGSSGACSVPPPGYLEGVTAICKKYDVKIVADEVACGAARTGDYFASKGLGLDPDVIVLGKGVNAGLIPTSVMIVKKDIVDVIQQGSKSFMHHQTYMHSPMMAACALEVLKEIEKLNLIERVKTEGTYLGSLLKKELLELPHVGGVTGRGFFWGITLVQDKATQSWFPPEDKVVMKLFKKAKELGLILWPVVGDSEAEQSDSFVIAPPYTMTREEMDVGVSKLKELLR
ncbi:MAG: aminotransferase class III-fold pyridoxal phosphate-dependent enzyme [Bdellovibrionota bacterium]